MPDSSSVPDSSPQRILLVRPTALGDVCRTVPVLASLRRTFPQAQIDWLVHEAFAPAVAAHPALSRVVPFPRKRFGRAWRSPAALRELLRWVGDLRRQQYDMVFDLQGLLRSGLFTRATGAPQRVGFANARELAWLGYNHRYAVPREMHTVGRMLALLQAHGIETVPDMQLHLSDDTRDWRDRFIEEHALQGGYVCLAPTAQWRCKCWPIEKYIELGRRLIERGGSDTRIVVLASPHEASDVQPLVDALGKHALQPTTDVAQLMALISGSQLLVGNDSAPLHIAVGFNRPTVAVFGPTDPKQVGPYQRESCVVQPPGIAPDALRQYRKHKDDQTLIAQITTEQVWNVVTKALKEV